MAEGEPDREPELNPAKLNQTAERENIIVKTTTQKNLTCICGATARDTSKERGRFRRRHPASAGESHVTDIQRMKSAAIIRAQRDAEKDAADKEHESAINAAVKSFSGGRR